MKEIILIGILAALAGCGGAVGGTNLNANGAGNLKKTNGFDPAQICGLLKDPVFETRDYKPPTASGCRGETYFGTEKSSQPDSKSDRRPHFSFQAYGDKQDTVSVVDISMYYRDDVAGRDFFMTEAHTIARMISDQPLPKEIEYALTQPLSSYLKSGEAQSFKEFQLGNAKVQMGRSENGVSLSFTYK